MNKLTILLINLTIIATPLAGIYFYFKFSIPQVKIKKSEINIFEYEKEINEKLFANYESLVKLFEEPQVVEQRRGNLPALLANYILIGITAGRKETSKAIIKNKTTNKQIVLKVGNLLEGAVLTDINFDDKFALFEKEGEQYKMELSKPGAGTRVLAVSREGSLNPPPSAATAKNTQISKKADWENKKPEEVIKIEKDQYTENLYYTDRTSVEYIKENLYKLAGEMYVKPQFKESGEGLLGIKIEQIKNNSVFQKVGFKPNDVITKINTTELNSIKEIPKLFYSKELYDSKDLTIYILRDGKEQKIQIKVRD